MLKHTYTARICRSFIMHKWILQALNKLSIFLSLGYYLNRQTILTAIKWHQHHICSIAEIIRSFVSIAFYSQVLILTREWIETKWPMFQNDSNRIKKVFSQPSQLIAIKTMTLWHVTCDMWQRQTSSRRLSRCSLMVAMGNVASSAPSASWWRNSSMKW